LRREPEPIVRPRHIAIVAVPLPGHWDPLRVLGRALAARGYRVTFVHLSDAQAMVEEEELRFAAVASPKHPPGTLDRYKQGLARASGGRGFLAMIRGTADMSEMLLTHLPDTLRLIGVDAVIADEAELAGALVARHLQLPYVTSLTGLPLLRDPGVPPAFVNWPYRRGALARRRNSGGYRIADLLMRPISGVHRRYAEQWGLDLADVARGSPLLQVAQCPAGLDFPRRDLPASFRYCGPFRPDRQPEAVLPDDGRRLVYCSLGSLQGNRPALFAAMTQACADLGARAVVAHGGLLDAAAARALPGDPIVAAFWPQPAILPRCSAAILHGGFNTVLDALAAGVPMVVAPLAFEQPGTAARVEHAGAGVALVGRLSQARLRSALAQVLDNDRYRAGAVRLQTEMSGLRGAEGAADLIDQALRTGRTPARA
jgi:zeaxanthin glucosyltransferase